MEDVAVSSVFLKRRLLSVGSQWPFPAMRPVLCESV